MERHAFAMKVKEGKMNDYRKILGEIWPELTAYLDHQCNDNAGKYYNHASDGDVLSGLRKY